MGLFFSTECNNKNEPTDVVSIAHPNVGEEFQSRAATLQVLAELWEIPELTSLSLCKLGFNSPDNPRHVLLKPAIQSEKGNEKELLL